MTLNPVKYENAEGAELLTVSLPHRRRRPLADAVEAHDGGPLVRAEEECRGCMGLMMSSKEKSRQVADGALPELR
jgi:hypothetical protein